MSQLFSNTEAALFFRLVLSHLLTDFLLQPTTWIKHKRQNRHRSRYLYWHSLIAGVLAYLFTGGLFQGNWSTIWIIAFVGITHGVIDYLKTRYGNLSPLYSLLANQLAHSIVLLVSWLWLTGNWSDTVQLVELAFTDRRFMAVLTGYLICTTPTGFVIGIATLKWQRQLSSSDTLAEAGKWIGIAERVIIFSFVLLNQYEAIGFLIAAKSLLRFKEGEQAPKQSEYVLVGTLLSYGLAIVIGLITKLIIE